VAQVLSAEASPPHPTQGIVHNVKEPTALHYSCALRPDGRLDCEFQQARVSRELNPDKAQERTEEMRKQFRADPKAFTKDCDRAGIKDGIALLEGRKKPDKAGAAEFARMTDWQKSELLAMSRAFETACKSGKEEEDFLKATALAADIQVRTCKVSGANVFKQTFRYMPNEGEQSGVWVVDAKPQGPCGVVQLSRFEPDPNEKPSKSGLILFWRYVARKAITNPKGELALTMKCSDFDESEYLFDWKYQTWPMRCDYIEFSVL
jgi:hypothetical protein